MPWRSAPAAGARNRCGHLRNCQDKRGPSGGNASAGREEQAQAEKNVLLRLIARAISAGGARPGCRFGREAHSYESGGREPRSYGCVFRAHVVRHPKYIPMRSSRSCDKHIMRALMPWLDKRFSCTSALLVREGRMNTSFAHGGRMNASFACRVRMSVVLAQSAHRGVVLAHATICSTATSRQSPFAAGLRRARWRRRSRG